MEVCTLSFSLLSSVAIEVRTPLESDLFLFSQVPISICMYLFFMTLIWGSLVLISTMLLEDTTKKYRAWAVSLGIFYSDIDIDTFWFISWKYGKASFESSTCIRLKPSSFRESFANTIRFALSIVLKAVGMSILGVISWSLHLSILITIHQCAHTMSAIILSGLKPACDGDKTSIRVYFP